MAPFNTCRLPVEVVLRILCCCDPHSIIRWRTVSKWFYSITSDDALWRALYKTSSFPRPPGPFHSQSRTSLERPLLEAERLAKSWTERPLCMTTSFQLEKDKLQVSQKLICGRWLVAYESTGRFILLDVDPMSKEQPRQTLWKEETLTVDGWDVHSVTTTEGKCFVYVLQLSSESGQWKVLEFQLNYETGGLINAAVMDAPNAGARLRQTQLYGGKSRLLCVQAEPCDLVLDMQSRTFYEFPSPHFERALPFSETQVLHMVGESKTRIRVFALPSNGTVLRLTHQGQTRSPILNSRHTRPTIDPTTGAITMSLVDCNHRRSKPQIIRADLTLSQPEPSSSKAMPITIQLTSTDMILREQAPTVHEHEWYNSHIDISADDGHIRGLLAGMRERRGFGERPWHETENLDYYLKFAVDTTEQPWKITTSHVALPEWGLDEDPEYWRDMTFDGIRGRICGYIGSTIIVYAAK